MKPQKLFFMLTNARTRKEFVKILRKNRIKK